jgi:hypothetical protein
MGDSTRFAVYSPPGFPQFVEDLLHVGVDNLAVKYPPTYTMKYALLEELPLLRADTSDAVLWLGVDDLRYFGMEDEALEDTLDAHAAILALLRTSGIKIYEVVIRDFIRKPDLATATARPCGIAAYGTFRRETE